MSLGTHTDTRIDNTHGVLKVCRLVPTAKSSNYKIIIKEHMINCLKQCVVNREMISNTPTTMADPGWGIWGKCPPLTFGGIILLIKILNFMSGLDQLTPENDLQILVAL